MLFTLTALSYINGVSQTTQKPYHIVKIEVAEKPGDQISGFKSSETDTWMVGDKVDISIKEKGEYNGQKQYSFASTDSAEGRTYKIFEFMESLSLDIAAIKVALQIADVPRPPKVRSHQTDSQREVRAEATAALEKDLEDTQISDLPF